LLDFRYLKCIIIGMKSKEKEINGSLTSYDTKDVGVLRSLNKKQRSKLCSEKSVKTT